MRIVCGVDLSVEGGDWLVARAGAFGAATGTPVDLVWVGPEPARVAELQALAEALPDDVRGDCRVVPGDVVEVLGELSRASLALVIGPREPEGLARFVDDLMATKVFKAAYCPVYVPRVDSFGERAPRLLVGIDVRGDHRQKVLVWAGEWAERMGGTVDVVYTVPGSLPPIRRPEMRAAAERAWHQAHAPEVEALEALAATLPEGTAGKAQVLPGEPEDALVRSSADYDLVLVGSRERAGLWSRLLVGHVADHVVRQARCDVLVLPTARTALDGSAVA